MATQSRGRQQRAPISFPFGIKEAVAFLTAELGEDLAQQLLIGAVKGRALATYIKQSVEIRKRAKALAAILTSRGESIPAPWSGDEMSARATNTTAIASYLIGELNLMKEAHIRAANIQQAIRALNMDDWTNKLPSKTRKTLGNEMVASLAAAHLAAAELNIPLTHARNLAVAVACGVEDAAPDEDAFLKMQQALRKRMTTIRAGGRLLVLLRQQSSQGRNFRVEK